MSNASAKKIKLGFVSVPMNVFNSARNDLIKFADVQEISFMQLNKANPNFSQFNAIVIGWSITSASAIENVNKIRSVWSNRLVPLVAIGEPDQSERNVAFELGISEWISEKKLASDLTLLKGVIEELSSNEKIYKLIELKANEALESKMIDDLKGLLDSLLFVDSRNRIFAEFLGEMLSKNKLYRDAFAIYDRVLLNQPQAVRILTRAGEMLVKIKEYGKAKDYFDRADKAAGSYLEMALLDTGRKSLKGGPEALNAALRSLNAPSRVSEYIGNRVSAIKEVDGDDKAVLFLQKTKKDSNLNLVKKLDYQDIIKARNDSNFNRSLAVDDPVKTNKTGGLLDYGEIKQKEKGTKKLKTPS